MDRLLSLELSVAAAVALTCAASAAACSSSSSTGATGADGGSEVDAWTFDAKSNCGHPGDKGNSVGVGQFCINVSDCTDNPKARLCTTFGDPENYFCTFRCDPKADPVDVCGENARCACNDKGTSCGCFPTRCDDPADRDAGSDAPADAPQETSPGDAAGD
jgi:hypothetical protein